MIENKHRKMKISEIISVVEGELITGKIEEDLVCEKFSRDTRLIEGGEIYIGLVGEKSNGGEYYNQALDKGAIGAIVQDIDFSQEEIEKYKDKVIIKVDDTLKALQKIAMLKRDIYSDIPIVAVTGSVGKTSTKDIIANVLSQKYNTLKTEGNYNNHIGVPLTLLRLNDEHEIAVIEMGMNHFGEISLLTQIAKPNICVITNVGTAHIGILGSRENILKAKLEILEGCKEKNLVINNDNDMLHNYYMNNMENEINVITYGIDEKSDVFATEIEENPEDSKFICNIENEKFNVQIPVAGRHFIYNALCAATVGRKMGLNNEEIKKGIETFELTKKRMDIETLKNGIKIINDSYNASYESMKGSIENLSKYPNRTIAVLGDMFELGNYSEELHRKVAKEVVKNKIDILICAGESAKYIVDQAKQEGMENIFYFENKDDILNKLKEITKPGDVILFKASNGMKFFELVENFKKD